MLNSLELFMLWMFPGPVLQGDGDWLKKIQRKGHQSPERRATCRAVVLPTLVKLVADLLEVAEPAKVCSQLVPPLGGGVEQVLGEA